MLSLSPEQLPALHLDAFIAHAELLNQHHRDTCATPFPKAPSRWLSPDEFMPRPMALTSQGDVDGGRSWLVGATLDFSFTRALGAPHSGARGGNCDAPARLSLLAVATKVDQYDDDAPWCRARHDSDKGRCDRHRAGLHDQRPGPDALGTFRSRLGEAVIDQSTAGAVDFLSSFGVIKGARWRTDGPLAPSSARSQGCTYACKDGQAFVRRAADRQALGAPWQNGATRLQLSGPFPAVGEKVREATAHTGARKAPTVTLLESATVPADKAAAPQRQPVATLLGLPQGEGPP